MPITQRRITAAEDMRALAHPLRLQLLELLSAEGAFTASEAARRLDESPANVSWHLRKLAQHGFVRQGEGPGRARPWKLVAQSLTFGDDAEDAAVATALSDLFYDREFQVMRTSMRHQEAEEQTWRDATTVVQSRLWLTPAEARALGEQIQALFGSDELVDRSQDPARRPPEARLMALMSWVVPFGAPPATCAATGPVVGETPPATAAQARAEGSGR